ncbi:hypothetical protein [uncultured Sanguibacteroides sp.]|uniref:ATP-grasp domain-containing protein n=1 Tax=uncultured Sanguibacteroides sp. TaxID=1635151 RepID=UPI0025E73AA2|nr:hypothetical protein [uncultured Sanguibacteroides sp.]
MKLGILKSFKELAPLVDSYRDACEYLKVDYVILDLFADGWIEKIRQSGVDGVLVRVKGNIQEHKSCFDERLSIIEEDLGIPTYPSRKELFLYENKRMYAYFLDTYKYPHPQTYVFYNKKQALEFVENTKYPIVFKTNGGASGSGVEIVTRKSHARRNVQKIFGRIEPRLTFGKVFWTKYKSIIPIPKLGMIQKHYAIIQEYIPIKWEWRIIKIGESYFGHQKLLKGQFASGSGRVGWVEPPKELLFLIKNICEKHQFDSMAMDVLESKDGEFYINELQSLFGSFLPYQMRIDDIPGRFIFKENDFVFEEGEFNMINSNVLRVSDFMKKINDGYYRRKDGKQA